MKILIRIFRFILPVILFLSCLPACGLSFVRGSGQIVTEERPVSGFDAINFSGSGELFITQGDTEGLTIEADDNLLPHIRTEVRDGELFIGFDDRGWATNYQPSQPIRFNLALKELNSLTLSGSGSVISDELKSGRLSLAISGSGLVDIEQLTVDDLIFNLDGSGQVDLSGQATSQQVNVNGSGNYRAEDLLSQTVRVVSSGSANVAVWVKEKLEAEISGSGSVKYYGSPQVDSQVSGSGKLDSLGEK